MSTTAHQEERNSLTAIEDRTMDEASGGIAVVLGDDSSTEKKLEPRPGPPPPPGTGTGLTSSPSTP